MTWRCVMRPNEYIEKVVEAGYNREGEIEENVVRSLPFFATTLGLILTAFGLALKEFPKFGLELYNISIYVVAVLLGLSVAVTIFYIYMAVKKRGYEYVVSEHLLLNDIPRFREFYQLAGLNEAEVDKAVAEDLQDEMIRQYARSTATNRNNNIKRGNARASALVWTVIGLALAFSLIFAIFARDGVAGGQDGSCTGISGGCTHAGVGSGGGTPSSPGSGGTGQESSVCGGSGGGPPRKAEVPSDASDFQGRIWIDNSPKINIVVDGAAAPHATRLPSPKPPMPHKDFRPKCVTK